MELTCPKCQGDLRSYERSGVTVDQCTECRGIFLDRGELEKLVDAEKSWEQQPARQQGDERQGYREDQHGDHQPRKKRKSSFFEELLG